MTNQEDHLGGSLVASTCIHVGALVLMYFGVPFLSNPPPLMPWTPVPVDIVEIGEMTNTRIKGDNDDEQTARTSPQEKPAPAPEEKPPEPPKPEPKPEPKPAAPEKPAPEEDDAALPTPQTKPKPPAPPKPPEVKKEEPKADPLASVLKNVAKLKSTASPVPDARVDEKSNAGESKTGTAKGVGPALSDRLTISQEDLLRRQISGCWNMPIGARNAEELIVEVLIEMNEDRTVRTAEVVDQSRMASDPYFRAAAESALRALRNPKCSPLELPPDQFEQWKTIRFNFDPRDML